jgi:hypothetical protein
MNAMTKYAGAYAAVLGGHTNEVLTIAQHTLTLVRP